MNEVRLRRGTTSYDSRHTTVTAELDGRQVTLFVDAVGDRLLNVRLTVSGPGLGEHDVYLGTPEVAGAPLSHTEARLLIARATARVPVESLAERDPLRLFIDHEAARGRLLATTEAPTDPALQVIWRAARARSRYEDVAPAIAQRYGVAARRWLGWIDELRELAVARALLTAAQPDRGVSPAFLYVIAIGEGMNLYLDANTSYADVPVSGPVRGFQYMGLDHFAAEAEHLRAQGFLPAWFRRGEHYSVSGNVNELGRAVSPANFSNLSDALTALAATLAHRRATFLKDAREILGARETAALDEDAINFFTYVYFNAGPGRARELLRRDGVALMRPWSGPALTHGRDARYNALTRMAVWRSLVELKVF